MGSQSHLIQRSQHHRGLIGPDKPPQIALTGGYQIAALIVGQHLAALGQQLQVHIPVKRMIRIRENLDVRLNFLPVPDGLFFQSLVIERLCLAVAEHSHKGKALSRLQGVIHPEIIGCFKQVAFRAVLQPTEGRLFRELQEHGAILRRRRGLSGLLPGAFEHVPVFQVRNVRRIAFHVKLGHISVALPRTAKEPQTIRKGNGGLVLHRHLEAGGRLPF